MKILFDTNVVLDVMLDRDPFAEPASRLMSLVESGKISGLLGATTVTTIRYLATKVMGPVKAQNQITDLMMLFEIAAVNRSVIEDALVVKFSDFEDAVLYQAARHAGVEAVVTRDLKGFKQSKIPVYNPEEMLNVFEVLKIEKDEN